MTKMKSQILSKLYRPALRILPPNVCPYVHPSHLTNANSVVHVMVVRPEEERLGLDTLFPWSVCPERRDLVFHCEMASLLVGDLIGLSVESHARRLLQALVFFRKHHGKVGPPKLLSAWQ